MHHIIKESFTFDDLLLVPQFSTIKSRSEVDISVELCKGFKFGSVLIPANMADVCGKDMIVEMYKMKNLSLMHRFDTLDNQVKLISELKEEFGDDVLNYLGVSVGIKQEDKGNLTIFNELGIKIVCLDIAHAHSVNGIEMTKYISEKYPEMLLIAGNVATAMGAEDLWKAGADMVKVGIGPSMVCTTRGEAAAGVPQMTAIMNVYERKLELEKEMGKKLYFISDGGVRQPGDVVKGCCFADMVMIGGVFSSAEEAPGERFEINGKTYKSYVGSSTHKKDRVEGVKALVEIKGSIKDIVKRFNEGLQSGCSYQDARNLNELKESPVFIKLSNAGIKESGVHDVAMIKG